MQILHAINWYEPQSKVLRSCKTNAFRDRLVPISVAISAWYQLSFLHTTSITVWSNLKNTVDLIITKVTSVLALNKK